MVVMIITGVIVWLIAVALILRFFAICQEVKRIQKPNSNSRNPDLHIDKDTDIERVALLFYITLEKINEATKIELKTKGNNKELYLLADEVYWEIDKAKTQLAQLLANK